jgi:hypothetical protein
VGIVITPGKDSDSRKIDIGQLILDVSPDRPVKIQCTAEGDGIIAIVVSRGSNEYGLILLDDSGCLACDEIYHLGPVQETCRITCMAISPNNDFCCDWIWPGDNPTPF